MNRKQIVKERMESLSRLNDKELVQAVAAYFAENATMPGEKAVKDTAAYLLAEMRTKPGMGISTECRRELIETFSSLCVKEVKLQGVRAKNETKKNEGLNMPKASDLPMELKDSEYIPVNTMKDTYEMEAVAEGHLGERKCVKIAGVDDDGYVLGYLPKGFSKNHRNIEGMQGTVFAADYSNGNFRNMNYTFIVDLAQGLVA